MSAHELRIPTTHDRELVVSRWDTPAGQTVRFVLVDEPGEPVDSDDVGAVEFDLLSTDVESLALMLFDAAKSAALEFGGPR